MRLTVVGCAGSYPNGTSAASCYLVEHEDARLLLDMGNGSLGALHQYLDPTDPTAISAVALSHCHIDHCADLASLYVVRHHHPTQAFGPLLVLGPSDTAARVAAIYGTADTDGFQSAFTIRTYTSEPTFVGPFTIDVASADHPVEAYSIRVSAGGRSITYSGDTGPNAGLEELARDTDIALFEASYLDEGNLPHLHMSGADAGNAARVAGARLLNLTHLVAYNDDAAVLADATERFAGPIELARPGMTVTL